MIFGAVIDEGRADEVRVTVIATGFGQQRRRRARGWPTTIRAPGPRRSWAAPVDTDPPGDLLDVPSFLRDQ